MSDPLVKITQNQNEMYYYDITGESFSGNNLDGGRFKEFDLSDDRFPMNTPGWVWAQSRTWNPNMGGGILPNAPGLAPADFTNGKNVPSPQGAL